MKKKGLYLQLFSIHGLVRGSDLELGRNADTGGQVKYVIELANALGRHEDVARVDLFTRLIKDKAYSARYAKPIEEISDKVRIIRMRCGGTRYIRKELLWPHLDEFVDKSVKFIKNSGHVPDLLHGHYADAGYVASEITSLFDIPFIFTGHSLGRNKQLRLRESGLSDDSMNRKFHIDHRIDVEENIIKVADCIVTSTSQEIKRQYGLYEASKTAQFHVVPPGIDLQTFYPFYENELGTVEQTEETKQAQFFMQQELQRFLLSPEKPLILALSRPDKKKNIAGLIAAYGEDKELQAIANLAVFAGIRRDIGLMDDNERDVLTELLLMMDKYDLYGRLAIPKRHNFAYEVPALYRIAAALGGVFVNPAFTEPFGLTLIEAAATGLPIVATDDGGPRDIMANCRNGALVDVTRPEEITKAIKTLLVGQELWRRASQNGIQNVRKHYSWDAHCSKYLSLVKAQRPSSGQDISLADKKIIVGKRLLKLRKLLITDIDDTLLGDEEPLAELTKLLKRHRETLGFGVATGRTVASAAQVLQEHGVPEPDLLITSVGSEIYYGPSLQPDKGWQTHIRHRWQREKMAKVLSELPFLELQETDSQRPCKLSYYMSDKNERIAHVHRVLSDKKISYNLIYSNGMFLDILPARASKGKAIRYLAYKWSIPIEHILVAGDSGNDEEMLRGSMLAVVVANHSTDLDELEGLRDIYFSDRTHAGGILDGLEHYEFMKL
jgi:sucrose-phosphate synthase